MNAEVDTLTEKQKAKAEKRKIAGWLLIPAIFLWVNLILAIKILLDVNNRGPFTRIIYPALYTDIAIGLGCLLLIRLMHRRHPAFPQLYILFCLLVYSLWSLVIILFNVGAHMQWMAVGLQCLVFTPYLIRSRRVRETFPATATATAPPWAGKLMEQWRPRQPLLIAAVVLALMVVIFVLAILLKALF